MRFSFDGQEDASDFDQVGGLDAGRLATADVDRVFGGLRAGVLLGLVGGGGWRDHRLERDFIITMGSRNIS